MIVIAVVLGSLIAFGPTILLGLVELVGGPEWAPGHTIEFIVPTFLGGAIVLWWLIRARQRGL